MLQEASGSWMNPGAPGQIYSQAQHRELERYFRMDAYPDFQARAVLAARLHLSQHLVRAWFRHRLAQGAGPHRPQWFPGLSRPPPRRHRRAVHSPTHDGHRPAAAPPPPEPWGSSPAELPGFCSGSGDIVQGGASAGPQDPDISDPSPDTAVPRGSTDLPSTLQAFQRLSLSQVTAGYHAGGIANEDKAGPAWF